MTTSKKSILEQIGDKGIVAVIRARDMEEGLALAKAVYEGGVPAIEMTMTVPGAVDILKELARDAARMGLILGAGTVLDSETARACILAGASYIVSPHLSEEVFRLCNRYAVPYMPGVGTVTEVVRALEMGAELVKAFPGDVLGPKFVKAVHGPIPHVKIMPTGGVSPDNLESWFKAGVFAVGMGGALTKPGGRAGDYNAVRETARIVVERIAEIRSRLG